MSRLWETVLYLFISDVIRAGGCWFLHGNQAEHLEQVVLHDIADHDKENKQVVKQKTEGNLTALGIIIEIITDLS